MKSTVSTILLFLIVAAFAGALFYAVTRWFASFPANTSQQSTSPIAFRRTSDIGRVEFIVLRNGREVYLIDAQLQGRPQAIGEVVRISFTIRESTERTQYTADLFVPQTKFPIELFAEGGSGEELVDVAGLMRALEEKKLIELRMVIDPSALKGPEDEAQLAALRGMLSGKTPPSDTPFRPIGIGYTKDSPVGGFRK